MGSEASSARGSPYALPRRGVRGDSIRAGFLRAVPMLAGLPEALRRQLASRSTWTTLPAGAWLFRKGDPGDSLYVVHTGRLEVVIESPGTEEIARVLTAGSVVGELALLTREPRSASVRARRDSELLRVTGTDFAELLSHEPRFSLALMRELGRQLRQSRGLLPADDPLPGTITVVSPDPGVARALWEALGEALAHLGSTAPLAPDPGWEEPDYRAALDRAERGAGRVLMLAGHPADQEPWTTFCLRQADRVLLVAGREPPPKLAPAGCDVVLPAPVRGPDARAWLEAGARAVHAVSARTADDAGVRRVARRLAGRSVGVVLSSGGARGLAHIGVLEELSAAGVEVDRVAGCSMGAFIGAMFAIGLSPAEIQARCNRELVRTSPLGDYAIPITSLLRGGRARSMLARSLGGREIEELEREFLCVSADLVTGEEVVHRGGPLEEAVAASMCLPGMFEPIRTAAGLLVDGGVIDSLPVGPLAATGEGPVVAVDVGRRFAHARAPASRGARIAARWAAARARPQVAGLPPMPTIKETLARSLVLGSIEAAKQARRRATVVVEPDTGTCEMLDFGRIEEMVEEGRRAARMALADDQVARALSA